MIIQNSVIVNYLLFGKCFRKIKLHYVDIFMGVVMFEGKVSYSLQPWCFSWLTHVIQVGKF